MTETAKEIRESLKKELDFSRRNVSVKCYPDYTIRIETKNDSSVETFEKIKALVEKIYYRDIHAWLCICIDNIWLKMKD